MRAGKVANLSAIGGEFNLEHFGLRGVHIDIPDGLEFGFGVGVPDLQGDPVLLGLILDFLDCLAEALEQGDFGLAVETAVRAFSQDKVVEVSAIRVEASDAVICMQVLHKSGLTVAILSPWLLDAPTMFHRVPMIGGHGEHGWARPKN